MNLKEFSKKNLQRCEESFHPLDSWSINDWMTAMTGEVGEAANIAKKLHRGDFDPTEDRGEQFAKDADYMARRLISIEIADVIIYADLLMQRLGFDTSVVVASKFNEVSARVGSEIEVEVI